MVRCRTDSFNSSFLSVQRKI